MIRTMNISPPRDQIPFDVDPEESDVRVSAATDSWKRMLEVVIEDRLLGTCLDLIRVGYEEAW